MSETSPPQAGTIAWRDLTVSDAESAAAFYRDVVGWETRRHPMGTYDDFEVVAPGTGDSVAGICHARGANASIPAQWLLYVVVEDVAASAARCTALGGAVLDGPRPMGAKPFCVIRDPAGAVLALIEA